MEVSASDWIAIVAVLVSLCAAFWSIKSSKEALRISEKTNEISQKANSFEAINMTTQYVSNIIEWGDSVVLSMTEGAQICKISSDSDRETKCLEVRTRLSYLIDTGRWYFPNSFHNDVGTSKPNAYRGYRQPILDYVVEAYKTLDQTPLFIGDKDSSDSVSSRLSRNELINLKREFTSCIQDVLDPRKREQIVINLKSEYDVIDSMKH